MSGRTDTERLEWLIRHMTGYELRRLFGVLSYTGDMPEIFNQIDAAMDAEEQG